MRFKPHGLTANGWAVKAGVSRTIWSDLRRHGNPSRRTLEKLLSAAGSSLAEFEALRVGRSEQEPAGPARTFADPRPAGWRGAPLLPIPILEAEPGGEWAGAGSGIDLIELHPDKIRGHVPRPASLAGDREAYAFAMAGGAMWPRFRPGRILLVSPAAPVAVGDDLAVRLAGRKLLIGELLLRTAAFVDLRHFNPGKSFRVDSAQIVALHKVMGEAI